jgi:hypothetical protein
LEYSLIWFISLDRKQEASRFADNTGAANFLSQSPTVGAAIDDDAKRSDKDTSNSFLMLPKSISPSPYGASLLSRNNLVATSSLIAGDGLLLFGVICCYIQAVKMSVKKNYKKM